MGGVGVNFQIVAIRIHHIIMIDLVELCCVLFDI